jgi:hypothetical protein
MPRPKPSAQSLDKLDSCEKLIATNPNVERKGATVPYTSLNGHMFSYLSKEGNQEVFRFELRIRRFPQTEKEVTSNL